ncbi:MAG: Hsp70 family protein [Pseudonocardiaceae bacterium]
MPYGLGIDLGTSCTVAAITRAVDDSARPEVVALGVDAPGLPTVLHLGDDGSILVGSAAEPLVISDPDRVFHGFLPHVGEQSASEHNPAALTARLVRWVVDAVANQEGGPPDQITLAHPAVWGPGECRAVQAALNEFGLRSVVLVPAPLTAAMTYAAQCHVMTGDIVAVYDLGATFSASVMRRESTGFTLLGKPQVIEDGGGGRFDEAILARVLHELGDQVAAPDLDDEAVLAGMAQLLAACVAAREALSNQLDVTIPVSLPDLQAEVRLTRDELEILIAAPLRATVTGLRAAITTAQLTPSVISTVVVTGGCAGMPQVARLLTADLGRPLAVLTDPELAAARGAAYLAAQSKTAAYVTAQPPPTTPVVAAQPPPTTPVAARPPQATPDEQPTVPYQAVREVPGTLAARPVVPERPSTAGSRPRRPRTLLTVAAGLLAAAAVALPLTLLRASDSGAESSTPQVNQDGPTPSSDGAQSGAPGAPLAPTGPGTTGSGPADIPASPPLRPADLRSDTPLAPQPPPRPDPHRPTATTNPTTSPPPGTPTQPPSTTTPPPTSTTTPPPTSTTTPPPPTGTTIQPPPTTQPPPTNPPPPTSPIAPPPPTGVAGA